MLGVLYKLWCARINLGARYQLAIHLVDQHLVFCLFPRGRAKIWFGCTEPRLGEPSRQKLIFLIFSLFLVTKCTLKK